MAHEVLLRVDRDDAFADLVLNAILRRRPVEPMDRAFCTELVYGTLRQTRYLDFVLGQLASKPLSKLPLAARITLRMGAYQILATRVPPHASVGESVGLMRTQCSHLAPVANAILRRLVALHETHAVPEPASVEQDPVGALAIATSHPTWLVRRMVDRVGVEETRAWLESNNAAPAVVMRVNRLRAQVDVVLQQLRSQGHEADLQAGFADAIQIRSGGSVVDLPGFAEGHFTVQDAAAQLIAPLAEVRPGDLVLDACAAPGGKATHLAELMDDRGTVIAVDIHPAKTRLIAEQAERLGLTSVKPVAGDAASLATLTGILADQEKRFFDAVLVDAPCSGMGTLRRNPELRGRQEPELRAIAQKQDALLDNAAQVLRPGGTLVYAVCTVTDEEGPERVRRFIERNSAFTVQKPCDAVRQAVAGIGDSGATDAFVRTFPRPHGVDGFFAARLVRSS